MDYISQPRKTALPEAQWLLINDKSIIKNHSATVSVRNLELLKMTDMSSLGDIPKYNTYLNIFIVRVKYHFSIFQRTIAQGLWQGFAKKVALLAIS